MRINFLHQSHNFNYKIEMEVDLVMDYSIIDNSSLVFHMFHPMDYFTKPPENAFDLMVNIEKEVAIHCRFYLSERDKVPWILYFHGNGEVVSDYDDLSTYYTNEGISLVVADYRGYGSSTGKPNFTNTVNDAPIILKAVKDKIKEKNPGFSGLWVMGRSLGSMPALFLAEGYSDEIKGLIIESGFASVVKLLKNLGLPSHGDVVKLAEEAYNMVERITIPTLLIHGENDQLVPLKMGKRLFQLLSSQDKRFFSIPRAGHNDIFFVEPEGYIREIKKFVNR